MKHFGDITQLSGYELPVVDVIVGGSPCQDLSVAGKRAGLKHSELGDEETTRSGLFMEQIRIVKEMRDADVRSGRPAELVRCRYLCWENVPGSLSSGSPKGADFQAVLEEICKVVCKKAPPVPVPKDGWPKSGCLTGVGDNGIPFSIAWRQHDAQFHGVPQRRKRLCVLADYNGLSAPWILFDPQYRRISEGGDQDSSVGDSGSGSRSSLSAVSESVYGDIEQSGTEGQGTPQGTERRSEEPMPLEGNGSRESHRGDGYGASGDPSFTLNSTEHHGIAYGIDQQGGKGGANYSENISPPVLSDSHGTPHGVAYGISSYDSNAMKSPNPHSGIYKAESSRTLDLTGGSPACNQGGVAVVQAVDVYNQSVDGEVSASVTAAVGGTNTSGPKVLAVDCRNCSENPDTNGTLQTKPNGGTSLNLNNVIRESIGN